MNIQTITSPVLDMAENKYITSDGAKQAESDDATNIVRLKYNVKAALMREVEYGPTFKYKRAFH